jgi:uncharacterized ParB-like nuclease family protein
MQYAGFAGCHRATAYWEYGRNPGYVQGKYEEEKI